MLFSMLRGLFLLLLANFFLQCSVQTSIVPWILLFLLWFLKIFIFSLFLHYSLVPQSSAFTSFVSSYVVQRLNSLGLGTTILHMCLICSDLWLLFILEEELKPHLTKLHTEAPSFCSHSCFFIHWHYIISQFSRGLEFRMRSIQPRFYPRWIWNSHIKECSGPVPKRLGFHDSCMILVLCICSSGQSPSLHLA